MSTIPTPAELREEEAENRLRALEDRVQRLEEAVGLSVQDMEAWYAARREGD
jgi:hypothetical protein